MAWTIEERDFCSSLKTSLRKLADTLSKPKEIDWEERTFQLFLTIVANDKDRSALIVSYAKAERFIKHLQEDMEEKNQEQNQVKE